MYMPAPPPPVKIEFDLELACPERTQYSTIIQLNGFQYTKASSTSKKIAYRCSIYRRTNCKGKVDFSAAVMAFTNFLTHTCQTDAVELPKILDIESDMKTMIDSLAISSSNLVLSAFGDW